MSRKSVTSRACLEQRRHQIYKAGDTSYEPSGWIHRVTMNPSTKAKTRLLDVILHPRDAKAVTVPEMAKPK